MKFTVSQPHSASEYYTMCLNGSFTHRFVLLYSAVARTAFVCFDTPNLLNNGGISVWNLGSVDVNVSLTPQSFSFLTRAYVHPRLLMTSRKVNECRPECEPCRIADNHFGYPAGGQHMEVQTASRSRQRVTGIYTLAYFTCILLRVMTD